MDNYFQTNWAGNEGHPAEDELLLYVDGGLAAGQAEHLRAHLETCWSCCVKTEKMNEAISDFIDYRNVIITPMFEPPPQGWRKLDAEMRRLLSPHAGESRQKYPIWRWLFSSGFGMRAAAALAFVLVILAGFEIGREVTTRSEFALEQRPASAQAGVPKQIELGPAEGTALEWMLRDSYSDATNADHPTGGRQ